ncbi:hypothetical protein H5999_07655 [[Clostridium] spiroforme]|nr:hypothetical protein [Thomasclavelia spiroformis]
MMDKKDKQTVQSQNDFTPFEKEFRVQLNIPAVYFTVFYCIYLLYMLLTRQFQDLPVVAVVGVLAVGYLFGLRPYKYVVTKRSLEVHKRIGKTKVINLMDCETITDPIAKMTKLITNAHSYEIYMIGGKRITVAPKMQMEFVNAILHANKRIHCQVEEYNQTHRKWEKKRRREERKANKKANRRNKKTIEE